MFVRKTVSLRPDMTSFFGSAFLPDLTEAVDIYSEWIDAADAAQNEDHVPRRPAASSSRPARVVEESDED